MLILTNFAEVNQKNGKFLTKTVEIAELCKLCKGVHCIDLGESFQTHILLQNLASIQPRTSTLKFGRACQCYYSVGWSCRDGAVRDGGVSARSPPECDCSCCRAQSPSEAHSSRADSAENDPSKIRRRTSFSSELKAVGSSFFSAKRLPPLTCKILQVTAPLTCQILQVKIVFQSVNPPLTRSGFPSHSLAGRRGRAAVHVHRRAARGGQQAA